MKEKMKIVVALVIILGLCQFISLFTIRGDMEQVRNIMDPYIKEFDEMENSVNVNSTISEIELVESAMEEKIAQWETDKYLVQWRLYNISIKAKLIQRFMKKPGEYGALRGSIGELRGEYGAVEGAIGALQVELTVLKMEVQ